MYNTALPKSRADRTSAHFASDAAKKTGGGPPRPRCFSKANHLRRTRTSQISGAFGLELSSKLAVQYLARMAVYIDDMYRYAIGEFRGMRMSHLIADSAAELHAMAALIGMKREWFQGDHYDVPLSRRDLALEAGAIAITYRQAGAMRRRLAVEGMCGPPEEALKWYAAWRKTL